MRFRRLTPLPLAALALGGAAPAGAHDGAVHHGYRIDRPVFALSVPGRRSAAGVPAKTAAAPRAHLPNPAFAGYLANEGVPKTLTARFKVPALRCTQADRAIGPGAFLLTGPTDRELFNAANIIVGCYRGVAHAQEVLVVNNTEYDYTRQIQAGDTMTVRLTDDPNGKTVVQLSDLNRHRRYTLKRSGRPAEPDAQLVGDWGSVDASTQAQVPPPAFAPTTFTSAAVDGHPLGSRNPLAYDMVSASHVLQIATGALRGGSHATFTLTRATR